MGRSRTFWVVLVGYVALVLTGNGIPLGATSVGPTLSPILLFSGAVGGVLFKFGKRSPEADAPYEPSQSVTLWSAARLGREPAQSDDSSPGGKS